MIVAKSMAEAAAPEGGKKKGGKMPMMIVLAVVLAGGGYFGMKASAPKEKPKVPEAALGKMMEMGKEFIVNLREREIFLRTTVVVQLDKYAKVGPEGGHGKSKGPTPEEIAMRNAVIERLKTISLADLAKPEFDARLRRLLAADINHALHLISHAVEEKPAEEPKKKTKKEKEEEAAKAAKAEAAKAHSTRPMPGDLDKVDLKAVENEDWDSDEGPVLRVYFTDFATMRE